MKQLVVGIFGFDFNSYNLGCEALTYSFISMLDKYSDKREIKVYNFTYNDDLGSVPESFPKINFERVRLHFKDPVAMVRIFNLMKKCDVFFDATFGDGFSDIYGKKWNFKTDMIKQMVLWSRTPLVLLPQTYGPYENRFLKNWAMKLISKSSVVYSRDKLSAEYVLKECGVKIATASDMAFRLPYREIELVGNGDRKRVGVNVSSLLWEGEWAEKNRTTFKADYQTYIHGIIDRLLENDYEVHLISHVVNLRKPEAPENDYRICSRLKEEYGDRVTLAPAFENPIDVKSYIHKMDIFIGARMHATIGAISSGVVTIPYSYSRKFEGLYGNIDYPYIISAKEMETGEAIERTMLWVSESETLSNVGKQAAQTATRRLIPFEEAVEKKVLSK